VLAFETIEVPDKAAAVLPSSPRTRSMAVPDPTSRPREARSPDILMIPACPYNQRVTENRGPVLELLGARFAPEANGGEIEDKRRQPALTIKDSSNKRPYWNETTILE
jgi:hypothetical protein